MVAADIATAGHPGVEAGGKEEAIRFWGPVPFRLLVGCGVPHRLLVGQQFFGRENVRSAVPRPRKCGEAVSWVRSSAVGPEFDAGGLKPNGGVDRVGSGRREVARARYRPRATAFFSFCCFRSQTSLSSA